MFDGSSKDRIPVSLKRLEWHLALFVLAIGLMMATASVRSPDAEVGFRTAEALALDGTFALRSDLESWRGFGLPAGKDGRRYSLFGPLMPMIMAPVVWTAHHLLPDEWRLEKRQWISPSHYFGQGLQAALGKQAVAREVARGHVLRMITSLAEIVILVLVARLVFKISWMITRDPLIATASGGLFALGTFLFPYITNLFSEPLAVMLTLAGLKQLVMQDPRLNRDAQEKDVRLAWAGLFLGLAVAAHVSAILALPFIALWVGAASPRRWRRMCLFAAGVALPLLSLAFYNYARFGDPLETGRGLQLHMGYGHFVSPWEGLFGLTLGFGKGLLWYCPLVLLAGIWGALAFKRYPTLVGLCAMAVLARLIFIASRSDWHGGFCLGPRYLLLALPLILLPALMAARAGFSRRAALLWSGAGVFAIVQQMYFASGEVFQFYYRARPILTAAEQRGEHLHFYISWAMAPFHDLLSSTQGPVFLSGYHGNSYLWWALSSLATGLGFGWLLWKAKKLRGGMLPVQSL